MLATWLRLLPTASARLAWRAAELGQQPAVGLGLFERRQILALQVFDECYLERLGIGERADDDRHLVQSDPLRGAPAALAGDQLEGRLVFCDSLSTGRTSSGCSTPFSRIDWASASSSASAKRRRGCNAPGRISSIGNPALGGRLQCVTGFDLAEQGGKAAAERAPLGPFAHDGGKPSGGAPGAARRRISAASWI